MEMSNVSDLSIEELNTEEARQYIGGIVFVCILMVCGFVGNIHVLLVYAFKIKPSNHRIFILVLGMLDFITCIIGMPFIIVDLRNPLTFTMVAACKVLRFINYYVCTASALTLLVIAVDRYRKLCVPLGRQLSHTMAKLSCLIVLGVSLLLSWPAPVLYGQDTILTRNPAVNGTRCYTEDKFKDTKFQAYFNAVLILVVFGVFGVLVVLYSLIGRAISRHRTFSSNLKNNAYIKKPPTTNTDSSSVELSETNTSGNSRDELVGGGRKKKGLPKDVEFSNKLSEPVSADETTKSSQNAVSSDTETNMIKQMKTNPSGAVSHHTVKTMDKLTRTTFMLFLITLVFFLSYVPHLVLKIVTFAKKDFVPGMSFTGKVFYNTFIWCFFINNVANSFIYGFCDVRFRDEVKAAYSRLLRRMKLS